MFTQLNGFKSCYITLLILLCARIEVSLRDVTIVQDETGDGERVTSCTGSARRFVGNLKKVRELKLDTGRRRSTFGARRGETNLRAMGAARDRGQMNKTV